MIEKRFELRLCSNGIYYLWNNGELTDIDFDKFNKESANEVVDLLNEQDEKIIGLEKENSLFKEIFQEMIRQINVEIPPENPTKYSGIFIFTAEQFYLLKELTKEK